MSDHEIYQAATGQLPQADARLNELAAVPLSDEDVLEALATYGVMAPPFPMRLEPDGEHPGDRVFRFPVALPDGSYLAVAWSFGQPSDDEMESWKPVWHSVDGPFTREQLEAVGRA